MTKGSKKGKRVKRIIVYKTIPERISEVVDVLIKLRNLGLTQQNPDIQEFKAICDAYVRDGVYRKGRLHIRGEKRTIEYILSIRESVPISINLVYSKHI